MSFQSLELAQANHQRFIERVAASRVVWGLKSADGWAISESTGNSDTRGVMPFWSDRAYAARAAVDAWSAYAPASIPMSEFIDAWLTGLSEDELLVGTNWDAANCGVELAPNELLKELLQALAVSSTADG